MKLFSIFLLVISLATHACATTIEEITKLVGDGHWEQARLKIAAELVQTNLDFHTRQDLLFQNDRMQRMNLEFNQTRKDIFQKARAIVPEITEEQFARWEKAEAVEFLDIDGTRQYFNRAAKIYFSSARKPEHSKKSCNLLTLLRLRLVGWQICKRSLPIMTRPVSRTIHPKHGA